METKQKVYLDSEEIDRAWNELIQAIKPSLNVTRIPSTHITPGDPKSSTNSKKRRLHHPALVTTRDLNNWEFLG